mmetsp:Transcript_65690/g.140482  ORF Transcript_65690/g.140482 Transcript_65690/m.140482 type:complete len:245 (+) Transcript_65690:56-790(+)
MPMASCAHSLPELVPQLKDADELILREGEDAGRLHVRPLPLQHLDELHLLLECVHQLLPLSLKFSNLASEAVRLSAVRHGTVLVLTRGLPQRHLELVIFLGEAVEASLLRAALSLTLLVLQLDLVLDLDELRLLCPFCLEQLLNARKLLLEFLLLLLSRGARALQPLALIQRLLQIPLELLGLAVPLCELGDGLVKLLLKRHYPRILEADRRLQGLRATVGQRRSRASCQRPEQRGGVRCRRSS